MIGRPRKFENPVKASYSCDKKHTEYVKEVQTRLGLKSVSEAFVKIIEFVMGKM
jgi:hypothetical protein